MPTDSFEAVRSQMQFRTLLVNTGAQQVLCALATECHAAAQCKLFQTGLTKTMKIVDFEQMQSQACVQVHTVAKNVSFASCTSPVYDLITVCNCGFDCTAIHTCYRSLYE